MRTASSPRPTHTRGWSGSKPASCSVSARSSAARRSCPVPGGAPGDTVATGCGPAWLVTGTSLPHRARPWLSGTSRLHGVEYTQTRGPHTAPRTAAVWQVLTAELSRRPGHALVVVDVGGGTGGFAVPLARAGHRVTVVDASPDALAALTRRATEAGVADRVTAVQGDGDRLAELVPAASADLVLCHSVLEVVDEPMGCCAPSPPRSARRCRQHPGRQPGAAVLARAPAVTLPAPCPCSTIHTGGSIPATPCAAGSIWPLWRR